MSFISDWQNYLFKVSLAGTLLSVLPISVAAQPTSFTNLDFDTALKQVEAKQKKEKDESQENIKKSDIPKTNRSKLTLKTIDIKLTKTNSTIKPQHPTPRVNTGNEHTITSMTSWTPVKANRCKHPNSDADLLNKGSALREVLFRFGGQDDFYLSFCKTICKDPKTTGWMTGMALRSGSGTSFAFKRKEGRCHYKIVKKPKSKWAALTGIKSACTCFPK